MKTVRLTRSIEENQYAKELMTLIEKASVDPEDIIFDPNIFAIGTGFRSMINMLSISLRLQRGYERIFHLRRFRGVSLM